MNQTIVTHAAESVNRVRKADASLRLLTNRSSDSGWRDWRREQVSYAATARLWLFGVQGPTMVGDWLHGGTSKVRRKCGRIPQ